MPPYRRFHADDSAISYIHQRLSQFAAEFKSEGQDINAALNTRPTGLEEPFSAVTRDQIADVLETAFWASLRANEGRPIRFCAAIEEAMAPSDNPGPQLHTVAFTDPVPFDETHVEKLAPALPQDHTFVVSTRGTKPIIRGFSPLPGNPWYSVIVRVSEPGIVRAIVGLLDPVVIVDGRNSSIAEGTGEFSLAIYIARALANAPRNEAWVVARADYLALVSILRRIAESGHGGAVLMVPDETGPWMNYLNPFPFRFATPSDAIHDAIKRPTNLHKEISVVSRDVAALASVDGAVVVTKGMRILGFGAKIAVADQVPSVCIYSDNLIEHPGVMAALESCGGTRHQSAVRFVHANKDAMAFVVSQDRHVSIVHWHPPINAVAIIRGAQHWM